ncbi:hypothetical protein, partial [Bacillus pacificus]|uniref:hypothetical protein n=1 Tax=Bacillus pacificus TaxID=2026187 RepID=UPI0021F49FAC
RKETMEEVPKEIMGIRKETTEEGPKEIMGIRKETTEEDRKGIMGTSKRIMEEILKGIVDISKKTMEEDRNKENSYHIISSERKMYPALMGSKTPTSKFSESKEVRWGSTAHKSPIGSTNNQWGMKKTPTD